LRSLAVRAALIVASLCASAARASACEEPARTVSQAPSGETKPGLVRAERTGLDDAGRRALERGLAWLAARQREDPEGAFPATGIGAGRTPGGDAAQVEGFAPVAVTALAALAYMAGGSAPERGPYGSECARAIDWLVARTRQADISERGGYIEKQGDGVSRMHGHGFATLALAQAYAMSPHSERGARIAAAVESAVRCIERTQGIEGGWYYEPQKSLLHENSITITAVQALRAAHGAGILVDRRTVDRAVDYVQRTRKEDGSFRYALGDQRSSVALTAAGISTLNAAGQYSGSVIAEAYDWLARTLSARASGQDDFLICQYYERLYLAQALWQNQDPHVFDMWWHEELGRVVRAQQREGSWSDPRFGDCYATAMNCLFLSLPDGLLPIFQR
jgi:hypothetical protein